MIFSPNFAERWRALPKTAREAFFTEIRETAELLKSDDPQQFKFSIADFGAHLNQILGTKTPIINSALDDTLKAQIDAYISQKVDEILAQKISALEINDNTTHQAKT